MQLIVWSMFTGVVIATLAGYLIKSKFGAFIRKLLENGIDSPEKAITLEELGLQKKFFIKFGLRSHTNYKNMLVAITEDGKFYANNTYTAFPPAFKEFTVVKRKRSRDLIKESKSENTEEAPLSGLAKVLQTKEKLAAEKNTTNNGSDAAFDIGDSATNPASNNAEKSPKITKASAATDTKEVDTTVESEIPAAEEAASTDAQTGSIKYSDIPRERVKFDIRKAKYYIPPEIHDRAYSLYHTKSGKINALIPIIVLLVILALIATFSGNLISGFTDMLKGIKSPFSKPTI